MNSFAPSYLFKNRFGIYYFRVRIPCEIRVQLNLKKTEIRKSLGTSNKREAVRLARIWWVKMENNEFNSATAGIDDVENDIAEHTRLLNIGRKLLNDLNKLEARPDHIYSDTDEFEEFLSPLERKALHVARVYFSQQSATTPEIIIESSSQSNTSGKTPPKDAEKKTLQTDVNQRRKLPPSTASNFDPSKLIKSVSLILSFGFEHRG